MSLFVQYGGQYIANGSHIISQALGTDFGSVAQGSPAVAHEFGLVNYSSPPVFVTAVQVPEGFEAQPSQPLPAELSQSSMGLTIRMLTAQPGAKAGTVIISLLDDMGQPTDPFTFDIAGAVVAPALQHIQRTLLGVG